MAALTWRRGPSVLPALTVALLLLTLGCAEPGGAAAPTTTPGEAGPSLAAVAPVQTETPAPLLAAATPAPTPAPTSTPSPAAAPATRTPASPTPLPVRPSATPAPTTAKPTAAPASPGPSVVAGSAELARTRAARQAVSADLRAQPDAREELRALAAAVAGYLGAAARPGQPLSAQQAAAEALRAALTLPGQQDPLSGKPGGATVATVAFGSQEALIVTLGVAGAPALAFLRDGSAFRPVGLTAASDQAGGAVEPGEAYVAVDRIEDADGDGQSEIVLVETTQGGSASPVLLGILQWSAADRGFRSIFSQRLSNWAGPAAWRLSPHEGRLDVVLEAPLFGPFDHKLLAHQQETRVYRWTGAAYALVERRAAPPEYRRQAFNVGEAAFRRGACDEATPAYQKVIDDPSLKPDEGSPGPDWVALAWFRIGECQAIQGRPADARAALEKARAAGPALGDLASRFLAAYRGSDAVAALGALLSSDLPDLMYEERAGNLGFPLDAPGVLYPGAALAAFARAHPDALQRSGSDLVAALKASGVPVSQALATDLDGDGRRELAAVVLVGKTDTVWLAFGSGGRWEGRLVSRDAGQDASSRLEGPRQLTVAGKPRLAFAVVRPGQPDASFAFDGKTALRVGPAVGASPPLTPVDESEFAGEFHLE